MRALLLFVWLAPALALAQPVDDRASIPRLIDRLFHEDPIARAEAARALGRLRAREAVRPLQVLAQTDLDDRVRQAASQAVQLIDPHEFVAKVATAEPAPVQPAPAVLPAPSPRPAVLVSAGAILNTLRAAGSAAAQIGAGLRWHFFDLQVSLGFPALSLFGQLRTSFVARARLVPYVTLGFAVAYNNGTGRQPTLAMAGGLGLRLRLHGPLQLFAEALVNLVLLDSLPPGPGVEGRSLSVPVVLGLSVEL